MNNMYSSKFTINYYHFINLKTLLSEHVHCQEWNFERLGLYNTTLCMYNEKIYIETDLIVSKLRIVAVKIFDR